MSRTTRWRYVGHSQCTEHKLYISKTCLKENWVHPYIGLVWVCVWVWFRMFWCGYVQSGVHDCVYTSNSIYPNPKMLKTKHLVVHEGLNEEYVKRCWWIHIHHLIISILAHTHTYTVMLYIYSYIHTYYTYQYNSLVWFKLKKSWKGQRITKRMERFS